jgi:hypothetical protein
MIPEYRSASHLRTSRRLFLFCTQFHPAGCAIAAILFILCAARPAWALPPATTTTLTVTSAGSPVTTVAAHTVVTLTATVAAGTTALTLGTVNFCDATAAHCTDIHILGTAQITPAGIATFKFVPGIGAHSYKAVFSGTTSGAASSSTASALTVTPAAGTTYPTTTSISSSGSAGNYTLSATVIGTGGSPLSPTGTVSFLDQTNSGAVLATAPLVAGVPGFSMASTGYLTAPGAPGAVADFNQDGKQDVASFSNLTLTVSLGNGDGTFTALAGYLLPSFSSINGFVVGDFNGDGIPDLVISGVLTTTSKQAILVFLGIGDGTFTAVPAPAPFGGNTASAVRTYMAVGDWNGDGKLDLAVAQGSAGGTPGSGAAILLGNGDGTFTASSPIVIPVLTNLSNQQIAHAGLIATADFNGDGKPDLVISAWGPYGLGFEEQTFYFYLGNGDGTFTLATPVSITIEAILHPIGVADLNGDGKADLVIESAVTGASNYYGNSLLVYLGNGDGTFASALAGPLDGSFGDVEVGDFNGDGKPDLATSPYIRLGNGDGSFGAVSSSYQFPQNSYGSQIANGVGDFNGDGYSDVATDYGQILLGQLVPPTSTATSPGIAAPGKSAHNVAASYPGDTYFTASISSTIPLGPSPTTLTLTPSPTSSSYGQQVILTAVLNPYAANGQSSNGESITFFNGAVSLGTAKLSSSVAYIGVTSLLPNATNSLTASYAGDANLAPATSNTVPYTVAYTSPTVTWPEPPGFFYGTALSAAQLNATASVPGTFVYTPPLGTVLPAGNQTLSAAFTPTDTTDYATPPPVTVLLIVGKASLAIAANNTARVFGAANPAFTGTITGAVNGDTFTESFSTTANASSIVGSYPIVPSVTGANLADYTVTPTNGALTISQAGTATTFALSNLNKTLTASVTSLTTGTPTGSVGFYEGQTLVGTGTLSGGTATYTTATFPAGNVVVTAQYSGDVNFTQSASPPILIFSFLPAATSLTVSQAGSVTDSIGLATASGFSDTVQFSCTDLPAGIACSFQPSSLTFTGTNTAASTTLTVRTGVAANGAAPLLFPPASSSRIAAATLLWAPGLLALAFARRKRIRVASQLSVLLLLASLALAAIGCGGGSPNNPVTSPGTSTVQVVATGASGFTQSTSLTLTVQ